MAGRLKNSVKGQGSKRFRTSHAVVIGINDYDNGIRPLSTPVNDATRLASLLAEDHGYTVQLLVEDVSKARVQALLTDELPPHVGENDRLLLYFAGHGIALDGDDGPQGFFVPQDASAADRDSLLPMTELHGWLDSLCCRHMLLILDCCFAGAFRWASTRRLDTAGLEVIHQERFERFLQSPAWQVLTSAAYDQEALDVVAGRAIGSRGVLEVAGKQHSPFALALYEALNGAGDLIPKGDGDGVITATELYLYLREQVEVRVHEQVNHRQTPGLWPLKKHDRGEYVFLTPGHELNLPPAPELTYELNPWRGLKSYNQEHSALFFGRQQEIVKLASRVEKHPFTVVLGASGTGKSSLVKAGVLPHIKGEGKEKKGTEVEADECGWFILPPLRPGATPLSNLLKLIVDELVADISLSKLKDDSLALADLISRWRESHPNRRLLLVVDQLEELVTLAQDEECEQFLALLAQGVDRHPDAFRLIVTLRTDLEPQFDDNPALTPLWKDSRYVVPPMDQADLRQVIEGPASVRVLYFEPPELVETLITEVIQTPGALPLLSFALSEMYIHYLASGRDNRALTTEDYDALGGVIGSLRNRANEEYEALPDKAHRETMQRVMLRMILVEGGELARRRVHKPELVYTDEDENQRVNAVLQQLIDARLLVTGQEEGEPTFEPAHDALVLAWDKVLRWKKTAERYLPIQRRVAQAAVEWNRAEPGDRSGLLWDDDPRLPQLEETLWPTGARQQGLRGRLRWARQVMIPNTAIPPDTRWLNRMEVVFVQNSVRERARFWQRLVVGVSLFVLLLFTATVIALALQRRAVAEAARSQALALTSLSVSSLPANRNPFAEESVQSLLMYAHGLAIAQNLSLPISAQLIDEQSRRLLEEIKESPSITLLSGHDQSVMAVAIDPNGKLLASGDGYRNNFGEPGEIRLWTLSALEEDPIALKGHRDWIRSLAFDPSGRWLASGSIDQTIRIWDMEQPTLEPVVLDEHQSWVNSVAFDPAGRWLASGSADEKLLLWNMNDFGEKPHILGVHGDAVSSVAFDPQGRWLASVSGDRKVRLWKLDDLEADPQVLQAHQSWVSSVAFDPEGHWMASGDLGGEVRLWKLSERGAEPAQVLLGHESLVNSVSFHPNGRWLASASTDGTIRLWDLKSSRKSVRVLRYSGEFQSLAFDRDGQWLASAGLWFDVVLWDLSRMEMEPQLIGERGPATAAVQPGSSRAATGDHSGNIEIWDLNGYEAGPVSNYDTMDTTQITSLAFDPKDRWVAAGIKGIYHLVEEEGTGSLKSTEDFGVRLWKLDQPTSPARILSSHQDAVESVAFDPTGRWLASAGGYQFSSESDNVIRVWDLLDLERQPLLLDGHTEVVNSIDFDPTGQWLASASNDSTIRLWDLSNLGNEPRQLEHDEADVYSAAFDSSGRFLASGNGAEIWIWDVKDLNAEPEVLTGHESRITSIEFDPEGRWLASASIDGTVRVWDLKGLDEEPIVLNHDSLVFSVTWVAPTVFDSSGHFLLTTSQSGEIFLWRLGNALHEFACTQAGRNFTWGEWTRWKHLLGEIYEKTCPQYPVHCSVPPEAWPEEHVEEHNRCLEDSLLEADA